MSLETLLSTFVTLLTLFSKEPVAIWHITPGDPLKGRAKSNCLILSWSPRAGLGIQTIIAWRQASASWYLGSLWERLKLEEWGSSGGYFLPLSLFIPHPVCVCVYVCSACVWVKKFGSHLCGKHFNHQDISLVPDALLQALLIACCTDYGEQCSYKHPLFAPQHVWLCISVWNE